MTETPMKGSLCDLKIGIRSQLISTDQEQGGHLSNSCLPKFYFEQSLAFNLPQGSFSLYKIIHPQSPQAGIDLGEPSRQDFANQCQNTSHGSSEQEQTIFLAELEHEFRELAEQWYRATKMMSFIRQKAVHPAYQRIIGMGWDALPFILRELRDRGGDWLWALEAISRKNPANGLTNFKQASAAWLAWGKENSYID